MEDETYEFERNSRVIGLQVKVQAHHKRRGEYQV